MLDWQSYQPLLSRIYTRLSNFKAILPAQCSRVFNVQPLSWSTSSPVWWNLDQYRNRSVPVASKWAVFNWAFSTKVTFQTRSTYIHNWSLQPISQDYRPTFSHHLLRVLILYISGASYSLKSTRYGRFLRTFSWQFYLFSEFLTEICWEEIAAKKLFVFCFDAWPGTRTLALLLISRHTTY